MCYELAVKEEAEARTDMVAGAVTVPEDGEEMAVIRHAVKTERSPTVGRQQGVDLYGIVGTGTEAADTGDDEVAEGGVVVVARTLLIALEPVASGFVEIFADVGFPTHVLRLHVFFYFGEV